MTSFQWFSVISILAISFMGAYYPLIKHYKTIDNNSFPGSKAFTSGVFLALSLTDMLPDAFDAWQNYLLSNGYPLYPVATYIAISTFIVLLALEHRLDHFKEDQKASSPVIPIAMTMMIGACSFLLGTALGVSDTSAAVMVFLAIIAHKGSVSFALALTIAKSNMTRTQAYLCFLCFVVCTPLGIILGSVVHQSLMGESALIFKAVVTSIASGLFLYLGTTYGLRHTPFVAHCNNRKGFSTMLLGLIITVLVSVLISYASHM